MAKLVWRGKTEVIGELVITFKNRGARQRIKWIRLQEFEWLQGRLVTNAKQEADAQKIRALMAGLRAKGVTETQMKDHGIDVAEFNRMSTTRVEFTATSYRVVDDELYSTPCVQRERVRNLQHYEFAQVELVNRQTVQSMI